MNKTTKFPQQPKADIYQVITNQIIAELEKGKLPWRKRWGVLLDGKAEVARNYLTKQPYTGINSVLLGCRSVERPYFITFKQAAQLGGNIRKGAKGIPVVYWNVIEKEKEITNRKGETKTKTVGVPLLKPYYVFHVSDVEGIDIELPELLPVQESTQQQLIERCEAVYDGYKNGPKLVFNNPKRAFYSSLYDMVNMPTLPAFDCPEAYFWTLYHELIHSTGHCDRMNREEVVNTDGFGGEKYAKEELTAEIGACFLSAQSGIDITDKRLLTNGISYLQSWLGALKNDKTLIVRAAGQAQKAANYITGQSIAEPEPVAVQAG
ncbi:ArdC family protein [Spirosoma endophyticum]|uniref:Antirestriction protein ArdC n=1 Tax=Spirosoma endophyticum TaxID=662367 RepID=A0A1I2BM15_9BACT|nr:ArdC-like ssDNA-binding domain-containing protein [Spirosoma endophyticum]SFE57039.1 Antirestriction protein ArdC [Spirosoma endophyticum]